MWGHLHQRDCGYHINMYVSMAELQQSLDGRATAEAGCKEGTWASRACSTSCSRRWSGIMTEGGSRCCSAQMSCARLHSSTTPHSRSFISGFTGSSCCLSRQPEPNMGGFIIRPPFCRRELEASVRQGQRLKFDSVVLHTCEFSKLWFVDF